jgi:hypothetical protein
VGLDFSWELDLWGRIRRTVESEQASAQASAGDLESARLSFQAELAQDYFQLRTLDAQQQLEPIPVVDGAEPVLVGRAVALGDRVRRGPAAGANRLRTGGL